MKIIIVDTNILFSAILNPNNPIGEILFSFGDVLEFYSSEHLRVEIDKHRQKIQELAKTSRTTVDQIIFQLFKRINFISDTQIPFHIWKVSAELVRDIDMDDLPFVALTLYLDGELWSGDMKLIKGLIAKGFSKCLTTQQLLEILKNFEDK